MTKKEDKAEIPVAMDLITRTWIPLLIWILQRAGAPQDGRTLAQSLLPPPDNVIGALHREFPVRLEPLLSPCFRRRFRSWAKQQLVDQFPQEMCAVNRQVLADFRKRLEDKGYKFNPSRLPPLKDIEQKMNQGFARLAENPCELAPISPPGRERELPSLFWELAQCGEGETRPKLRQNSKIWDILGIDPKQFQDLTDDEALKLVVSLFVNLFEMAEQQPARLISLMKEFMKIHLPVEQERPTTPVALSKAAEDGLIHRGRVVRDKETGEVVHEDVEDQTSTDFLGEVEDEDARQWLYQELIPNLPEKQRQAWEVHMAAEKASLSVEEYCRQYNLPYSEIDSNWHNLLRSSRQRHGSELA